VICGEILTKEEKLENNKHLRERDTRFKKKPVNKKRKSELRWAICFGDLGHTTSVVGKKVSLHGQQIAPRFI